jgi:signal transduction histidine kinase
MRRLWRSTFGLVVLVSIALAAAALAIGAIAYEVTHEALEEELDRRVATETAALLAEPGPDRLAAIAAAVHRREAANGPDHLGYILVDAGGQRVAGRLAGEAPAEPGYQELLPYGAGRYAQALTTAVPGGGRLVVAADRGELDETDRQLMLLFTVAFGGLLVVGVAGAWTVGAVTRTRLERIDQTALAIIGGDFQRRMPRDGSGSEFDRVSETLNQMLDRIAALMDNLRQVSSDVAHDLRTPLTRLRNRLEEAQGARDADANAADANAADASNADARDAAVAAAIGQAEELLEIFSALLRISEIEAMRVREQFCPVALGSVLAELVETYRPDAEASGHQLVARIDQDVAIAGDRRLLLQLASNLLDNALRHTPAGTTVTIALHGEAGSAVLTVSDDGPGVPPEDRARLFQRFSRSERSRSSSGHGLGLALVSAIAQAHRGTASLAPGPAFAVRVKLGRG